MYNIIKHSVILHIWDLKSIYKLCLGNVDLFEREKTDDFCFAKLLLHDNIQNNQCCHTRKTIAQDVTASDYRIIILLMNSKSVQLWSYRYRSISMLNNINYS